MERRLLVFCFERIASSHSASQCRVWGTQMNLIDGIALSSRVRNRFLQRLDFFPDRLGLHVGTDGYRHGGPPEIHGTAGSPE